jgi:probable F420-dependent oxidoreductase
MHYAVEIVTLGENGDPRNVVRFARAAEEAGWDGLFVWDHLAYAWGVPSGNPWIGLAAAAQATQRIRLGTSVTPVPRHLPPILAHTVAELDVLSEGRVIFGSGLGGVAVEYTAFGLPADAGQRARQLDEGLDVINRLWSGQCVSHHGEFYTVNEVTLAPLPVQRPRIPIWIGGTSRPAMRRAARWDGWVLPCANQDMAMTETPVEVNEHIRYVLLHRDSDAPMDIAITGYSEPGETAIVQDYAAAGVTWWFESLHGYRGNFDALMARIKAGPPRVA